MGARFIGADRDQVFLMPPSVRGWVPGGHLVWTVLDAVGELDLSAFYADYRADGHGRPAYEPSMMVDDVARDREVIEDALDGAADDRRCVVRLRG